MNTKTITAGTRWKHFLLYSIAAFLLFVPVINKYFVSDDFLVLKRVCLDKTIRIEGFFRPLSDCTLYVNYLVAGLSSFGFNLTNLLIHAFNSYLLFILCCKWNWTADSKMQRSYAMMAGILFLSYPFHNEAVVWILGRGASLAGMFGILALIIFLSSWKRNAKFSGVCGCYFIGLLAYESIIVLPALIFILLFERRSALLMYFKWALFFFVTLTAHFIIRHKFSGALLGAYGGDLLKTPWLSYPGNIIKTTMRLIVPPVPNSGLFLGLSTVIVVIAVAGFFLTFKRFKSNIHNKHFVLCLSGILGCTLVVPFLFAVSTRTSESDRFLYFPSFFACCFASFLINRLIKSFEKRLLVFAVLCIYNIVFLELNNFNWYRAGKATCSILKMLKSDSTSRICIANLPNEINGAYVFREGFKDALIISRIDTARIIVINKLSKELQVNSNEIWKPVYLEHTLFIPPMVEILINQATDALPENPGIIRYRLPAAATLYYWDHQQFVLYR